MDTSTLMKLADSMSIEEIEEKFRSLVSDDIWHDFIERYFEYLEFSIDYNIKGLTRAILEMRKGGYSDERIAFIGRFEFTEPDGSTIKLRGI